MSNGRPSSGEPSPGQQVPAPGQLLRRALLGTSALYRVIGENERGVEVEVVAVEGLRSGSRFTFSVEDVLAMERVSAADAPS